MQRTPSLWTDGSCTLAGFFRRDLDVLKRLPLLRVTLVPGATTAAQASCPAVFPELQEPRLCTTLTRMAAAGRAGLWRTPSARPRGARDRAAWEEEERVDEGYEEEHEAEHKEEHESAEQLRSDEEAAAEQEGAYLEPEPEPEPEPGFHLQRGALHLSAATKTEREVARGDFLFK